MPASIARIEVFVLHLLSAAAALPSFLASQGRHVVRLRDHVAKAYQPHHLLSEHHGYEDEERRAASQDQRVASER